MMELIRRHSILWDEILNISFIVTGYDVHAYSEPDFLQQKFACYV